VTFTGVSQNQQPTILVNPFRYLVSQNESFNLIKAIFLGWKSTEKEEKEEKKTFNSSSEIFLDYSEYSTIQGLIYIFFSYQVCT